MLMSSVCQRLLEELFLLVTLREGKPIALLVECTNVYGGCIATARRDFFVQPYQLDPELDPEGEAPEEVQTLCLQQDVSEWLVCLNNVSLFVCVVTVTAMKLMANS